TELAHEKPEFLVSEGRKVNELFLPSAHPVPMEALRMERLDKSFNQIYERSPNNFEELLGIKGVGPKSLRALSLISELIHGVKPSFKDPARFSFAHGGKDGDPYPVDRKVYDQTIQVLKYAVEKSKVGDREKMEAIRRLRNFAGLTKGMERSA
ncbi:MAG: DUF763 domain-containing protein, partial [Thermodesulfobacteriota bacterium]